MHKQMFFRTLQVGTNNRLSLSRIALQAILQELAVILVNKISQCVG